MKLFHQSVIVFSVLNLVASHCFAFEREHSAHEHGHAKLLIVVEGNAIELAFHSPAVNIVGFEHQASSAEDKKKLADAVKRMSAGDFFVFDKEAQCKLTSANVTSELLGNKHEEAHETVDREHDESRDETHSEFEISYRVECQNIAAAKNITVKLFSAFSSLEEVEAEIAGSKSQQMIELNAKNTVIPLQ